MADNKKSFVLYTDLIHTVNKLSDQNAGQLFKHILAYVNDQNPVTEDILIEIAFEPIKQQLKRDLRKYESRAERSRANGLKGGRPKNLKKPKKPNGFSDNPIEPKKPDNANVNVNDNVNVIEKEKKGLLAKWVLYRTELKKPIKKASMNALINKFNREKKEVLAAAIQMSIENGWQGLFVDKVTGGQKSNRVIDNDNDFN